MATRRTEPGARQLGGALSCVAVCSCSSHQAGNELIVDGPSHRAALSLGPAVHFALFPPAQLSATVGNRTRGGELHIGSALLRIGTAPSSMRVEPAGEGLRGRDDPQEIL